MHLNDISAGISASIPIVASSIPIAVGIALSIKMKKENRISVVFFGEAATEEGVFFESINFAQLNKLPILFVCENNKYSVYSNLEVRIPKNRDNCKIVNGFGVKNQKLDGTKFENNILKINKIIKEVKKNSPYFLEISTYRYLEHCGPNNDDYLNYRSKKEIKYWMKKDPIKKYRNELFTNKILNDKKFELIKKNIDKEIELAFNYAKNSNFPKYDLKKFLEF